jgi:hypothetical protein
MISFEFFRLICLTGYLPFVESLSFAGAAVHGEFKHLLLSIVESLTSV